MCTICRVEQKMSSPDGQVSRMAQNEVGRRLGTERLPAIPSTSTRAIAPCQGQTRPNLTTSTNGPLGTARSGDARSTGWQEALPSG
jgi:hypothetical protein